MITPVVVRGYPLVLSVKEKGEEKGKGRDEVRGKGVIGKGGLEGKGKGSGVQKWGRWRRHAD